VLQRIKVSSVFFESDGNSPSKKRKITHVKEEEADSDVLASPSKRKPRSSRSIVSTGLGDEEDGTEREDELVGEAIEDEDELDDEDDDVELLAPKEDPEQDKLPDVVPNFRFGYRINKPASMSAAPRKKPASSAGASSSGAGGGNFQRAQSGPPASVRRSVSRQPASRQASPAVKAPNGETLTCPICAKELETDNAGLNAHIDFCLSKDAIMQATSLTNSEEREKSKYDKGKQPAARRTMN